VNEKGNPVRLLNAQGTDNSFPSGHGQPPQFDNFYLLFVRGPISNAAQAAMSTQFLPQCFEHLLIFEMHSKKQKVKAFSTTINQKKGHHEAFPSDHQFYGISESDGFAKIPISA